MTWTKFIKSWFPIKVKQKNKVQMKNQVKKFDILNIWQKNHFFKC